jgi:polysaccharide biosynthesis/export protein
MHKILRVVCFSLVSFFICSQSAFAQGVGNPYTNPYGGGQAKKNLQATLKESATNAKQNPNGKGAKAATVNQASQEASKSSELSEATDESNFDQEGSLDTLLSKKIELQDLIYGQSFLNSRVNLEFANENNYTTPPSSYRLGPGDEVIINIWGTSELQQTYKIGKDGAIYPALCGKINVSGLSFAAARQVISSRFNSVLSEGSKVDVQLAGGRSIKVTVLGEVNAPGTFTMSAFNTAFNAITKAGGVNNLANLREIQIKRNGSQIRTLDLYEFLNTGDFEDAYLEDGDIVVLGVYEKKVKAEGKFKRPMYYLLKQEEDLSDLIRYSGGPTYDARFSSIQIQSVVDEQPIIYSINLKEQDAKNMTVALKEGDIVRIKLINVEVMNKVVIAGAVTYPDNYQVEAGEKLMSIIEKAGGILPTALEASVYVYRGDSNANGQTIKVDLRTIKSATSIENIELFPFDSIVVVDKSALQNRFNIEIIGAVNRPGTYNFSKGMTVRDLITLCGGFKVDAESDRIEISRVISSIVNNYEYEEIKGGNLLYERLVVNPNVEQTETNGLMLKPLDKVFVRTKSEMLKNKLVTIGGEVFYPGKYPILYDGESLTSIIQRAGGIRTSAYLEGLRFNRAGVGPIAINLPSDTSAEKGFKNIVLNENDSIYIPQKQTLVAVKGEVQNNINIQSESGITSLEYYISAAGGFGEQPWKNKIYVQYPNGVNKSTKKVLFTRIYPKVTPGSTIVVPRKPDPKENSWNWRDSQGFVISIMSIITTGVTTWKLLTIK